MTCVRRIRHAAAEKSPSPVPALSCNRVRSAAKKAEKKEDKIGIFPENHREIPALALSKSGTRVEAVLPLSHKSSPFLASLVLGKYITYTAVCQVGPRRRRKPGIFADGLPGADNLSADGKNPVISGENQKKELAFLEWCDKMIEKHLYCAVINCRCTDRRKNPAANRKIQG